MEEGRHVADGEALWMSRNGEIRFHKDSARAIQGHPERAGERSRLDAGRPEHGSCADLLAAEPDGIRRDPRHHGAGAYLYAQTTERPLRALGQRGGGAWAGPAGPSPGGSARP